MRRNVVVLPQPEGPSKVTNWLSLMSRSRSATAASAPSPAPKRFDNPLIVIPAIWSCPYAAVSSCPRGGFAAPQDPAAADLGGEPDRRADDDHVDHGECRYRLDIAGLVEIVDRDRERDGARGEQQDRRAQFLDDRHEDQEPAGE